MIETLSQANASTQTAPTRGRRWLFRFAALLLGLSLFLLAEAVCMVFDWGRVTDYDDPFVGFSAIHPLFVLDETGKRYEIAKSRLKFFAANSFPAKKGQKTFRVFCLGGSTVQGRPFSIPTSFTTWLRIALEASDSRRDWEIVNCGGISYASYRLVPILEECLTHDPDLIVLCTGHNEFLEERTYEDVKYASPFWTTISETLGRSRLYTLMRDWIVPSDTRRSDSDVTQREVLPAEVVALLDYNEGIQAYHRDAQWRAGVIRHYEHNLRRMLTLARAADVPIVLMRPPSNLSDCPPFKSEHRADFTADERKRWESLIDQARSNYRISIPTAVEQLKEALELDPQHAATYFELGECYESLGLRSEAKNAFLQARENDICPLRILAPMEAALAAVAEEFGVPLVDAHALLEQKSFNRILGNLLLVDHIHPSPVRGHQMIAEALHQLMVDQEWVQPVKEWEDRKKKLFDEHFASLKNIYFLRGKRTLRSLRGWTQGRADGPNVHLRSKPRPTQSTNP